MKKTGYWKGFTSALVLVGLVTALGVTATAASKRTIEVEDGIKITINDAKFTPRGRRRQEGAGVFVRRHHLCARAGRVRGGGHGRVL